MPGTCVVGLQWGDEAKGKLVDLLTSRFDIVVRYQGGANAGHTVVLGDEMYKLHLIPSGILNSQVMNVIAAGVVVNPQTLVSEMDSLIFRGIDVKSNLILSERAHVVFPWHVEEDRLVNQSNIDGDSIGTTLRGIGPCYRDKVGRTHAIRLGDMLRNDFATQIEEIVMAKKVILSTTNGNPQLDAETIFKDYQSYADRLRPLVVDTTNYLLDAVEQGKKLLFEGAQGSLLDIDHGTFPFVTSSNSSALGATTGSGVPGRWVEKVIGVIKTYSTRVGGGPFPTELVDDIGQHIRIKGNEFGTTTGRPRRCGWFDAVAVRYTSRLSGATSLSAMMLDVLSELPEIKICVAYEIDGVQTNRFPCQSDQLRRAKPVYEVCSGWQTDITDVRRWEDLPENARFYVERISMLLNVPVEFVSVGPDRAQTILREEVVTRS